MGAQPALLKSAHQTAIYACHMLCDMLNAMWYVQVPGQHLNAMQSRQTQLQQT